MIQSDRWQQIEQICEAALKRQASERAAFVKEACGEDEALRQEVEQLLAHEEAAKQFLETPALEAAAKVLAEDRSPSLLGQQIDCYQVISLLGAGGMGEVYRARDTRLGREVAIKVLPSAFSTDADRLRRFEQEARAAGRLNHPNILTVHDIGTHQTSPYIVCELLEGKTLRETMRETAIPARKALKYALEILRGLAAAHEKGIVHRDLKPENLFLTQDGRLKILDFGLAKLTRPARDGGRTESTESHAGTLSGLVLGTIGYMAPEQVRGEAVDHRCDLFSFGAILYEMLSGQRAFRGKSDLETMNAIVKEEPHDLTSLSPHIPSALQRIIRHCLEKSPQERYQAASDIAFDLELLADPTPVPQKGATQKRERFAWIIAGVLSLILLAVLVAYFRRAPTDAQAVHFSISPPKSMTYPIGQIPAISPDGRRLAFVAKDSSGQSKLYVQALDSPRAQALEGTEGASRPFWSPDNRFLAYFGQGKLKRIPVAGGPPQALCEVQLSVGGTWSRKGTIIFGPGYGLRRVSQDGGLVTPVVTMLEGTGQETLLEKARWSPYFLPDDNHFLFAAYSPRSETRGIYVGSLDAKESKRISGDFSNVVYAPPGYLLFVRDWTLMAQPFDARRLQLTGEPFAVADDQLRVAGTGFRGAFSVSETAVLTYSSGPTLRELVWFDRAGRELGRVGTPDAYDLPALSPDGNTIAVQNANPLFGAPNVWLVDASRGTRSPFTSDPNWADAHVWSPDGNGMAFSSPRNGNWDLYQKATGGTAQEELLLKSNENKFGCDWSRDGRFITYYSYPPEGGSALWVLPLVGDRRPIRFSESKFNAACGCFSTDGRWLAYISDESGAWEVSVRPFPGSAGRRQVSTGGGGQPRWRRDGKELFYIASDGKLMAVEVTTTGTFYAGPPRALFQVPGWSAYGAPHYAVTADGQRFLFAAPPAGAASPAIKVVVNWSAVVKGGPLQ